LIVSFPLCSFLHHTYECFLSLLTLHSNPIATSLPCIQPLLHNKYTHWLSLRYKGGEKWSSFVCIDYKLLQIWEDQQFFCVMFVESIGVYVLECFKYSILYNDDCLKFRVGVL
jgi:hypothetical protein